MELNKQRARMGHTMEGRHPLGGFIKGKAKQERAHPPPGQTTKMGQG